MATGTQSFVGEASAEFKVTDAETGELLGALESQGRGFAESQL
jgi:hypothetical protein